jgi:hypothetical protein
VSRKQLTDPTTLELSLNACSGVFLDKAIIALNSEHYYNFRQYVESRHSSVGISTGFGMEGLVLVVGSERFYFSTASRQVLGRGGGR